MIEKKDMDYYLLTSIGVRPKEGKYKLGDRMESGLFSSSALVKLLGQKPKKVFVLLTADAREISFDKFKKEVGLETEIIDIPDGVNDEEIRKIIGLILKSIPEKSNLVLDISQAFRHFPFLFFTSVLYLQSFKGVKIQSIYYGMYEKIGQEGFSPFIELGSILEMIDWYHSLRDFSEKKISRTLANVIERKLDENIIDDRTKNFLENLVFQIRRFDDFYGTGLAMGVGDSSKSIVNQYEKIKDQMDMDIPIPMADELFDFATASIKPFKLMDDVNTKGNWKQAFGLDISELERQSRLIDSYLDSGHYVNAIRLMREWIISRCVLSTGNSKEWLKKSGRKPVERMLGSIHWQAEKKILVDEKKELASIWDSISKFRNDIAHNGMNEDKIDISNNLDSVEEIWRNIKDLMQNDQFWNLELGGGGGRLLVTPLGYSKGLLYSALKQIKPDLCMIITSKDAGVNVDEILKVSDYQGEKELIELSDPHTGFDEIKGIINSIIPDRSNLFIEADEIFINLTGGTTTLQVLVEAIYSKAVQMGKDPKKVVIFDRRPYQVQQKDPFKAGEMIYYEDIISCKGKEEGSD